MSRVLDEIVQEVESKAPVLKRQREEYESMQRSMASLCNKLEQARMVRENYTLHSSVLSSTFIHLLTPDKYTFCKVSVYFVSFSSLGDLQFAERERGGQAAL